MSNFMFAQRRRLFTQRMHSFSRLVRQAATVAVPPSPPCF